MENNFDNVPENTEVNAGTGQDAANGLYTDPNGAAHQQQEGYQNTSYQQQEGYQNTNYQQQYQDNYSYNTGNNTGYAKEYSVEADNAPISLGEWILILLLMSIPCVNIILCIVWGFGKQGNITKRNFCRAQLIFVAIGIALSTIILFVMLAVVGVGSYGYYVY